jgi:murein DD-endopeptidase MepM/ murein hydrolase activator NlpD
MPLLRPRTSPRERDPALGPLLARGALLALTVTVVAIGLRTAETPEQSLLVPVQGVLANELRDSFEEPREGGRLHRAIDIPAARGTPVLATDDGVVLGLDESPRGGIAIYQRDARGERCFYYGHLAKYRAGLAEGVLVRRGETLGFVGSSGNAPEDAPHLHFEIRAPGEANSCDSGRPSNPFDVFSGG